MNRTNQGLTEYTAQSGKVREHTEPGSSEIRPERAFPFDSAGPPDRAFPGTPPRMLLIGGGNYELGMIRGYCQFRGWLLEVLPGNIPSVKISEDSAIQVLITDLKNLRRLSTVWNFDVAGGSLRILALLEQSEIAQAKQLPEAQIAGYLVKPLDVYQLDRNLGLADSQAVNPPERRKSDRRNGIDRRNPVSIQDPKKRSTSAQRSRPADSIASGPFRVDRVAKKARMANKALYFTPKEFELFSLFLSNPGQVFSVWELIERFWGTTNNSTQADVYQYIYRIRQQIEDDPKAPQWLVTVRGFGYAFRCDENPIPQLPNR
ncbi:MAG: winged helix-turn-helix domain-containing protein [Gammaproteobacteria bacterium]